MNAFENPEKLMILDVRFLITESLRFFLHNNGQSNVTQAVTKKGFIKTLNQKNISIVVN